MIPAAPPRPPLVVLVHGAWAGGWVWDAVVARLESAGHRVVAPTLPDDPALANLDGYVAAVESATAGEDRVVVVGHSGGGVVASEMAERHADRVIAVAFVCGILLPSGTDFPTLCAEAADEIEIGDGVLPFVERTSGGTSVPPEVAVAVFLHRAAAADAIAASRRLRSQPDGGLVMTPSTTPERFGAVPALYVEALADRSIPIGLQRYMHGRAGVARVVSLDTDHTPQLSDPAALAGTLHDFLVPLS